MRVIPYTEESYRLLHEGAIALAKVEAAGIRVDVPYVHTTLEKSKKEIEDRKKALADSKVMRKWRRRFGTRTNLNSGEQLGVVLFDILGHDCPFRTATGKYKTDEETLQLVDDPFVREWIHIKKLNKGRDFLKGILEETCDGFLHPTFNLHIPVSYRSCIAKGTLIEVVRDVSRYPKGIPIEDVKPGDFVYCYNQHRDLVLRKVKWAGKTGHRRVIRLHWYARGKHGHLDLTPEHKVRLADGRYLRADRLVGNLRPEWKSIHAPKVQVLALGRVHDRLGIPITRTWANQCGRFVPNNHRIVRMEELDEPVDVFDIEVDGCHNFIANEICVHNSSDEPNFQNLPVRIKWLMEMVRRAIRARPGRRLVEIDYKGIEVCGAYCYHKDPNMRKYLLDKTKDMHRDMAMACYMLGLEEVGKLIRYSAKNQFVFPQFYGAWWLDCAAGLWRIIDTLKLKTESGVPLRDHLKAHGIKRLGDQNRENPDPKPGTFERHIMEIEKHFWGKRFPTYAKWKKQWYEDYLRKGWFQMLTGFICQGLMVRNEVINLPVQGASFHCLLWSMNQIVNHELRKAGMKAQVVGQIHDSIIGDVPDEEVPDYVALCREVMTKKLREFWDWVIVPLQIEVEITPLGGSWAEKVEWCDGQDLP